MSLVRLKCPWLANVGAWCRNFRAYSRTPPFLVPIICNFPVVLFQVPSGKIATLLGTVASSDHLLPSVVMMGVTCRRLLIISFELHIIFVGFSLLFSVVCFVLLFVVFAVSYSN